MFPPNRQLFALRLLLVTSAIMVFLLTVQRRSTVNSDTALAKSAAPEIAVRWSVPERFGAKRKNGLVDFHWDGTKYDRAYVNPDDWKVDFDACAATDGPVIPDSFVLEIAGQQFEKGHACRFSHAFPGQGAFAVRVTRRNTEGQNLFADVAITIKDYLIVSIGDSYASGEGNPDIPLGTKKPVWIDKPSHRSAAAGPAKAALMLEASDPHSSVTFLSFACSGASIQAGLLDDFKGLPPQLNAVQAAIGERQVDALLISIGGNDIGFSTLVKRAIRLKDCSKDDRTNGILHDGLVLLPSLYADLAQRLSTIPTITNIFITEYPDILHDETGEFCDHAPPFPDLLFGIREKEARWASDNVVGPLNELIKLAADRHHWIYVNGISDEFLKHGYCAHDERWARTFNDSWKVEASHLGTAHPNAKGHEWYASRLLAVMREHGIGIISQE